MSGALSLCLSLLHLLSFFTPLIWLRAGCCVSSLSVFLSFSPLSLYLSLSLSLSLPLSLSHSSSTYRSNLWLRDDASSSVRTHTYIHIYIYIYIYIYMHTLLLDVFVRFCFRFPAEHAGTVHTLLCRHADAATSVSLVEYRCEDLYFPSSICEALFCSPAEFVGRSRTVLFFACEMMRRAI